MTKELGFVEMTLNRDLVYASVYGHSVRFVKNEKTKVPRRLVEEVIRIGAVRADGEPAIPEDAPKPVYPTDFETRQDLIAVAIEALVERNNRDDWTGQGTPKVTAISQELKFSVDRTEVAKAWERRAQLAADEREADAARKLG